MWCFKPLVVNQPFLIMPISDQFKIQYDIIIFNNNFDVFFWQQTSDDHIYQNHLKILLVLSLDT